MIKAFSCHFNRRLSLGLAVTLVSGFLLASGQEEAPAQIDLTNFPGQIVEKVVVPIPAEIFAVLDKLGEPNWGSGIALPSGDVAANDRSLLALTFGGLVAEGFIAVQAKDADKIQKIGREVLTLSNALGLTVAVRPHSLSIIEAAGDKDWSRVRDELDSTQQTVRETMEKLRDEELSNLVSLGGWLRGTNVVTIFISDSFSEDKAELLNQPGLIVHFREVLEMMEGPSGKTPAMRAISVGLARLESIIGSAEIISEEDVRQLRDITRSMLEEFYYEKNESAAGEAVN
ncbi:MAG: hypothetical protein P1U86_01725 [Verrucomicrobiales bacterium]|nr:hypothetical protein [Verrucomicrobiales bacterium]